MSSEKILLPNDLSRPVIELWYVDQGRCDSPEVAVYANGRVQVRVGEGSLCGELEVSQVELLVRDLLVRDRLSQVTTEHLAAEIMKESVRTGLSAQIATAGDTIIRVRTIDGNYRIDGHAVGLLSSRFPEVPELQLLYSAQRRLENVRAVVMVGGASVAQRLARMAQAQVQAESGESIFVRPEDLSSVHSLTDGTRCCQFVVSEEQGTPAKGRIISLFESPGEIPRVSVLPDGPAFQ